MKKHSVFVSTPGPDTLILHLLTSTLTFVEKKIKFKLQGASFLQIRRPQPSKPNESTYCVHNLEKQIFFIHKTSN
jgi:hypothetical protein